MTNGEDYKNAEELEANKLSLEEKKILLNLFSIYSPENKDDMLYTIMEKYFINLISDPYDAESSIIEKEFLVRYAIKNFYILSINKTGRPEIGITDDNTQKNCGEFAKGQSFINIYTESVLNGANIDTIQTGCHEYEHLNQ